MLDLMKRITNLGLFLLACCITATFFYKIGSNIWESVFLGTLAVFFEMTKRIAWIEWIRARKILSLSLALILTGLSVLAGVSFAMGTIEADRHSSSVEAEIVKNAETQIQALTDEAKILRGQLEKLPEGWVTSSLKISSRLDEIHRQEIQLNQTMTDSHRGQWRENVLDQELKKILPLEGLDLTFWFFVLLFSLVEFASTQMLSAGSTAELTRTPLSEPSLVEILEKAYNGEGNPILGRFQLAEKMGLGEKYIRNRLERLQSLGILHSRGKRLYLTLSLEEARERIAS